MEQETDQLLGALSGAGQIPGLARSRTPVMELPGAYELQAAATAARVATGAVQTGYKVAFTARPVQRALGVDAPAFGPLFADMGLSSGAAVSARRFYGPRVEAEVAFLLARDLPGGALTSHDVLAATEAILPAIEIVDCRVLAADPETGLPPTSADLVADFAGAAGYVLGSERHAPTAFDLARIGAVLHLNGQIEATGLGALVMGDPAASVAWLGNELAKTGQSLRAGQVVLSGSLIMPLPVKAGDHVNADFGPFGSVSVLFT